MKNIDTTKVIQLRKLGHGYKRIAQTLSITLDEVRNACNEIGDEVLLTGNCKNCGISITSTKGKKMKRFCSDQCRWDWWNNHYKN
jgi:hypothetical protein